MLETRLSTTIYTLPLLAPQSALLIRIYPQEGIGEPLKLTGNSLLIGREDSALTLSDDSVSRRHATIERQGDGHIVRDLGSTNGTFVNETKVTEAKLTAGDRLRFGNQIFKYLTSEDVESQYHEVVYKIMTTDGLTQVYNKQYLLESLERELQCARRTGEPLSVMLMDLDHFKSVNDTYGHLAGDAVLVEFANRARSVLRSGDILCRYGGEEFAILCSRATLAQAAVAAERVRSITAETPIHFASEVIPVTVSIGIASVNAGSTPTALELLASADHWLYAAKNSGRNQVQFDHVRFTPQA